MYILQSAWSAFQHDRSENAVYKSAINFLIKDINPHILLFLKRGRPSVHNVS